MSVVAGLCAAGSVYLGGDAAARLDDASDRMLALPHKVFRKGAALVGVVGSSRSTAVVAYDVTGPKSTPDDPLRWVARRFTLDLRRWLEAREAKDDVSGHSEWEGQALVALGGRLFHVGSDFAVSEAVGGYFAIGTGGPVAEGVLFATAATLHPADAVYRALEGAAERTRSVRPPFTVLRVGSR